jgi:hypothetical protein
LLAEIRIMDIISSVEYLSMIVTDEMVLNIVGMDSSGSG